VSVPAPFAVRDFATEGFVGAFSVEPRFALRGFAMVNDALEHDPVGSRNFTGSDERLHRVR